jgi:hypothetical protein
LESKRKFSSFSKSKTQLKNNQNGIQDFPLFSLWIRNCGIQNMYQQTLFGFVFRTRVEKNFKIWFSLEFICFYVFRLFWCIDIKNSFFKIKKNYFDALPSKKHFEKQPLHNHKYPQIIYIYVHTLRWFFKTLFQKACNLGFSPILITKTLY